MKFSNGTELRFGKPKHSQVMVWLLGVGGVFRILSWFIAGSAKNWLEEIGMFFWAVGLVILLAGTITERKEWQAKQKTETE